MLTDLLGWLRKCANQQFLTIGNLNAEADTIAPVWAAIRATDIHDLGAAPALTGQDAPLLTCVAHKARSPTRRDYALAPATALLCMRQSHVLP